MRRPHDGEISLKTRNTGRELELTVEFDEIGEVFPDQART